MSGAVEEQLSEPAVRDGSRLTYRRYWLALYRRDLPAAERIVEQCLATWRPQRVYLRLFEPALILSGTLFARGEIGWRDEHFITHHTSRLLRRARRLFVTKVPTGPLAVVTSIAQDSHRIGLRMVCDFIERDNWRVHWLSSNDRAVLRQTLLDLQPSALLLSLGLDQSITPARRIIASARRCGFAGVIVAGGGAINRNPGLVAEIGADFTAPNGALLARALRKIFSPGRLADHLPTGPSEL